MSNPSLVLACLIQRLRFAGIKEEWK